jgi:hypothetical protein
VSDDRLRDTPDSPVRNGVLVVSPDGASFAAIRNGAVGYVQTIGVAAPHQAAGWELEEADGWYRGWAGSLTDATPVSASFVDGRRLLIRAGNRISRWDPGTGRRLGQAMPLPASEYGDWAARPGHEQLMAAPRKDQSVELWNVDGATRVRRFGLDKGSEGRVVFSRDGSRALAKRAGATAALLDIDEGGVVARMPRSGELPVADGTSNWESDFSVPAALLDNGDALLGNLTNGYLRWTRPDRRVPLLSTNEVAYLPAPDRYTGGAPTIDYGQQNVLYSVPHRGSRLLPLDPTRLRASLCAVLGDARINTTHDGRQSCAGS